MQLIRYARDSQVFVGLRAEAATFRLAVDSIAALLRLPSDQLRNALHDRTPEDGQIRLLPPVDRLTEVWASGVTYHRSSTARQDESSTADVYARVYEAQRPELFFKSPAWRVVGLGEPVGIRDDSPISVPEPELAVVVNTYGEIVGFTICDDMSSRTIEGENPLYLPQAKIYAGSCAIGPGISVDTVVGDRRIEMTVTRNEAVAYFGTTSTGQMHRDVADLVEFLYRQHRFPDGAILSTGTGIVPDLDFTLQPGDVVDVTIEGIGVLSNEVRSASQFAWLTPDPARTAIDLLAAAE